MSTLTTILAILVALEHLYIMFLETIATSSESTSRVFGISIDQQAKHHPETRRLGHILNTEIQVL